MTTGNRWPQVGDLAVELTLSRAHGQRDMVSGTVRIVDVTDAVVLTSDAKKYSRRGLWPVGGGHESARRLRKPGDPRVLIAQGRGHLTALAKLATNLSMLDHAHPESVVAALAQIMTTANESRVALVALMAEASRAEQESNR